MLGHVLLLIFAVFCGSTAVIMIKASAEHALYLAAYRQLAAALMMLPLFIRDVRRYRGAFAWSDLRVALVPGIVLGLHFITWIIGARMTTAVNASLIVNLAPLAMPFLLLAMVRERINARETLGTVVALAGLLLLSGADFSIDIRYFWGDLICLLSMILFTCYLVYARKNRRIPGTALYVVPLYTAGGLFCLLAALPLATPVRPYSLREFMLMLGLAFIPTVLGHSLYNRSMKHLRGQVVSILAMSQFIFAGILAYFMLDEIPAWPFYAASVLVVGGGWLSLKPSSGS